MNQLRTIDYHLCFPPGTEVVEQSPSHVEIRAAKAQISFGGLSPGLAEALRQLASKGAMEKDLADIVLKAEGSEALPKLHFLLLELNEQRILCHRVCSNGEPLATSVPISSGYRFEHKGVQPRRRYALSRFAYSRRVGPHLIVESPLSHARLILHDWRAAALLGELAQPRRPLDLFSTVPGLSPSTTRLFLDLLFNASLLSEIDAKGRIAEDDDDGLMPWEFHDLLFHARSRAGRHANPYGKTDRLVGKILPPLIKPKMSPHTISLYRPNIDLLKQEDIPFTRVMEERRSRRVHGEKVITDRELGEFLYRSARVRRTFRVDGQEYTDRVYPNAGAAYELELYPALHRCEGIAPGLYHYCPRDHQLCRLSGPTRTVERLVESAGHTVHAGKPQALIIIAARFHRMSRSYESICYANILKDVGVLYQTMYLVATAMGLSACALGCGDSDLFTEAAGANYYMETSVGEFILGH